jgi:hypothetical protein
MNATLVEFAQKQADWVERTAEEYRVAMKGNVLLRMSLHYDNSELEYSLRVARQDMVPWANYANGVSASELREEIFNPGSFRAAQPVGEPQ